MAVQKSRKSRSARGMRRSHDSLTGPTLSINSVTGEIHLRHHVTASGYHRDRAIDRLMKKPEETEEE